MRDPPMAVSTYHVHWGVQLGTKAPELGPWDGVLPPRSVIGPDSLLHVA